MATFVSDLASTWFALGLIRKSKELEGFGTPQAYGEAQRALLLATALAGSPCLDDNDNYRLMHLAGKKVEGKTLTSRETWELFQLAQKARGYQETDEDI